MAVVVLSEEEKICFGVFSWLRKKLPDADICMLRHISVYVARTCDILDIETDIKLIISVDKTMCNLLVNDGTEIRFKNSSDKSLNFVVEKRDLGVFMNFFVSTYELNNLSTAIVVGDVVCGDWNYTIGFDDYDNKICFIKIYYKNKLIENGTSYFNVVIDNGLSLGCIDGLGYITDLMVKIELLYNNVRSINKNELVRRKCV